MKKDNEWEIGKKIKEIKTDRHQHKVSFLCVTILIDLLLIGAVIFFLIHANNWIVSVVMLLILVACLAISFRTFNRHDTCHTYTIYDNCIIIKSLWSDRCVLLKDIFLVEKKENQHIPANHKTITLVIYEKNKSLNKYTLPHITEDIDGLIAGIMALANKSREKEKTDK